MKFYIKHARYVALLALIIINAIIASCGEDPTSPTPDPEPESFILADSTIIVPAEEQNTVLSYDRGTGEMELDKNSQYAKNIVVGTILVGQDDDVAPNGFLRKVTSVTTENDLVKLETGPALLTDAYEMLAISDTIQLRPSQIEDGVLSPGNKLVADANDLTFNVPIDSVLYDGDSNYNTTDDQIRLTGNYAFEAAIVPIIDIDWRGLQKCEFILVTEEDIDVDIMASVEFNFENVVEYEIWKKRLTRIPLGNTGLWITLKLAINAFVHGDASVTWEAEITGYQDITNGFGYQKGGSPQYYPIFDSEKGFQFSSTSFSEEFDFEVATSVTMTCLLCDVAGPFIGGKVGFDFLSELSADPCNVTLDFNVLAALYAVVGVEMDVEILSLKWDHDFEIYSYPVYSKEVPLGGSGTVFVDPNPDEINAPWSISGPCGYYMEGTGDSTLPSIDPGVYSIHWGAVSDWSSPADDTQTLTAEGTITFSGTYVKDTDPPEGFVYIQPGTFTMGSPIDEPERLADRETQHQVTLTRGFIMSKYEVTEKWWYEVMGGEPTTSQMPKDYVSWDMAVAFCNALSDKEGLNRAYTIHGPDGDVSWNRDANGYRLPTEAEWEYACRADSQTAFANGPITNIDCDPLDPVLDQIGWYCGNSGSTPHEVGQKQPNDWGLFDMHGNLWEWVWDGYQNDYENLDSVDPVCDVGPGALRVDRGGCWLYGAQYCRSAYRGYHDPGDAHDRVGLRPVRFAD